MEAFATSATSELEIARLEIMRLRDAIEAQTALLRDIVQNTIILDRAVLAEVGPALRAAGAGSLRGLVRLLEDLGEDGVTKRAWTGKALGEELGLARANHERLIAPLVEAGVIEPVGEPEHKARHYQLHSSLNAQWVRALLDQTRSGCAFGEQVGRLPGLITPFLNAHSARVSINPTRIQRAHLSANAHSERASDAIVCLFDQQIDPSPDQQTNNAAEPRWDGRALELFQAAVEGQGIGQALRVALRRYPPVNALALVYHAREEAKTSPGALLRAMLKHGAEPAPQYVERARRQLNPPMLPEPPRSQVENRYQLPPELDRRRPAPDPEPEPEPEPVGLDERPGGGLSVASAWRAVMDQLKAQLNHTTYQNVKLTRVIGYADGVLTVRPRGYVAAQWFERASVLGDLMSRFVGAPIAVRVVNEAGPAAPGSAAGPQQNNNTQQISVTRNPQSGEGGGHV